MKPQKLFIYLLVCFLIWGSQVQAVNAQRDSAAVRELLEQRDEEIKDLLGPEGTDYTEEQREELKDIINGIVDYGSMAQFALQTTYDTLSSDQRQEFIDLFSTIIRDQSLSNLNIYRADVTYDTISVEGDSAYASTTAQLENVRTPVDYKMFYDDSEQQWFITDISIDEVSTAGSYRRQFQSIIRKRGYDALIDILKERVDR